MKLLGLASFSIVVFLSVCNIGTEVNAQLGGVVGGVVQTAGSVVGGVVQTAGSVVGGVLQTAGSLLGGSPSAPSAPSASLPIPIPTPTPTPTPTPGTPDLGQLLNIFQPLICIVLTLINALIYVVISILSSIIPGISVTFSAAVTFSAGFCPPASPPTTLSPPTTPSPPTNSTTSAPPTKIPLKDLKDLLCCLIEAIVDIVESFCKLLRCLLLALIEIIAAKLKEILGAILLPAQLDAVVNNIIEKCILNGTTITNASCSTVLNLLGNLTNAANPSNPSNILNLTCTSDILQGLNLSPATLTGILDQLKSLSGGLPIPGLPTGR